MNELDVLLEPMLEVTNALINMVRGPENLRRNQRGVRRLVRLRPALVDYFIESYAGPSGFGKRSGCWYYATALNLDVVANDVAPSLFDCIAKKPEGAYALPNHRVRSAKRTGRRTGPGRRPDGPG